MVMVIESFE